MNKEAKEERYAMRFFLFLLIMAIIGALSSCTPVNIKEKRHNKTYKAVYSSDSSYLLVESRNGATTVFKYDSVSGFYTFVDK